MKLKINRRLGIFLLVLFGLGAGLLWKNYFIKPAQANPWFDDNWAYRQIIVITNVYSLLM